MRSLAGNAPPGRKSLTGIHPDIREYGSDGGARSFHLDVIRAIKADVFITPNEGKYKMYLLENAQTMTVQAQNALLKILEEPPSYAVFLLTAESRESMLPTILSRCVTIPLSPVSEEETVAALRAAFPDRPEEELRRAAGPCAAASSAGRWRLWKTGSFPKQQSLREKWPGPSAPRQNFLY